LNIIEEATRSEHKKAWTHIHFKWLKDREMLFYTRSRLKLVMCFSVKHFTTAWSSSENIPWDLWRYKATIIEQKGIHLEFHRHQWMNDMRSSLGTLIYSEFYYVMNPLGGSTRFFGQFVAPLHIMVVLR